MISVKNADKKKFDFWTKSMEKEKNDQKMFIFWPFVNLQFFAL